MAIKISGSTIIDDSRVIVNADKIGIGTLVPSRDLEIYSDVALASDFPSAGIAVSATTSLTSNTPKAFQVFNNSSTTQVAISYTGRIDANEYFGTFKGTIDAGVVAGSADQLKVTHSNTNATFTLPFVDDSAANNSYQSFLIDNNASTSLLFNPSTGHLQINGAGKGLLTLRTTSNTSDRGIAFQNSGNNYTASIYAEDIGNDAVDLVFLVDDTNNASLSSVDERMRITNDGKLLIGVDASTSNDANLQVFKPSGNNSTIAFGNVATSVDGLCRVDFCPSNKTVGARIECHATENFSTTANRTADLVFVTRKDGIHGEKLRITSDGKVGIGITNPSGQLHISSGTANSDCRLIIQSDTDNNDETSNPQIWFKQDGDITAGFVGQNGNQLVISNNISNSGGISFRTGFTDNTGTTDPFTGSSERFRIASNGTPSFYSPAVAWHEGPAVLEASNGYGAIFFRSTGSTHGTSTTGTWSVGKLAGSDGFAILKNGLTGGGAVRGDAAIQITNTGNTVIGKILHCTSSVGIRTDNPTTNLHVRGNGVFTQQTGGTITNGLFLNAGDTGQGNRPDIVLKGAGSAALNNKAMEVYYNNGSNKAYHLRYDGGAFHGGFVGIGTDNPGRPLTITNTDPRIRLQDSNSGGHSEIYTDNDNHLYLTADSSASVGGSRIVFQTDGANERARITNTGELKIANGGKIIIDTNPGSTYGISEALRIDDTGGTSDRALQIFEYHHNGGRWHSINYNLNVTTTGSAYTYTQGNYEGSSMLQFGAGQIRFYTDASVTSGGTDSITPSERLRIESDGDTTINSVNDKGLFVKSNGNNASLRIRATGSTDGSGYRFNHNAPTSTLQIGRVNANGTFASTLINFNSDGDVLPENNGTQDLGSSGKRWNILYAKDIDITGDISLSGDINADDLYVAGIATFADDVQVADQIRHLGDPDTMIEFENNRINFDTGGSQRVLIDSDGDVGINTSSITAGKLEVNMGDVSNSSTDYFGENFAINIRANRGDAANDEGNGIVFSQRWWSNSTDIVRTGAILGYKSSGSGNFGGGLLFKTQKGGASPLVERLRIDEDGQTTIKSTTNQTLILNNTNTNGQSSIQFQSAGTSRFIVGSNKDSDGNPDFFIFDDTNDKHRFNIKGDGKIGIGTDNPGRELDVYKGTGNDCTIVARVKSAGAWFEANSETSSGYYGLKLRNGNTEKWFLGSYGSNNLQLKTATANASSLLEITSAGKVGIGTATPIGDFTILTDGNGYLGIDGGGGKGAEINVYHKDTKANTFKLANNGGSNELAQYALTNAGGKHIWHIGGTTNEKMRLTTTGLGIGTNNPTSKLEVWNNANIEVLRLRDTHNNKYLTIRGGGSPNRMVIDSYEGGGGGAGIDLASNGDTKVRIKSDGDVGIGTNDPESRLTIFERVNSSDGVVTLLTLVSDKPDMQFPQTLSNTSGGAIKFLNSDDNNNPDGQALIQVNTPDSYTGFTNESGQRESTVDFNFKQTNNGVLNTTLTIKGETGDVGIGTNNPTAKLQLEHSGLNAELFRTWTTTGSVRREYFLKGPTSGNGNDPYRWCTGNSHSWEVDNSEKMRINYEGDVGINEASNINGRLHVQHDALAENILYASRYNDQNSDKPILAITEAQMTGMTSSGLVIGNHNRDIHIGSVFGSSADVTTTSTKGLRITGSGSVNIGGGYSQTTRKLYVDGDAEVTGTLYATISGSINPTGNVTITGNLQVNGNTTLGNATSDTVTINATPTIINDNGLYIRSANNAPTNGAQIRFSDQSSESQKGFIKYKHSDGSIAPGSNDGFIIGGSETLTIVKVEGRALVDKEVGIGTDTPEHQLDIFKFTNTNNSNTGTTLLRLNNHVGSSAANGDIKGLNGQRSYIDFRFVDTNVNFIPQVRIGAQVGETSGADSGIPNEGSGSFVVYTAKGSGSAGAGTLSEKFRVDPNGRVGIGSAIPSEKLDVTGNIKVDDGPILESSSNQSLKVTTPYGYVEAGPKNSSYSHFNTDRSRFYFNKKIILDEGILSAYASHDLLLTTGSSPSTSNTGIFIKNSTHLIGIGNNNPTHRLHVYGAGNNGGVRIENSHSTTTVSGNTAVGAFPHNLVLSNYSGQSTANDRMVSIGFDIPTTGNHANATIAYQAVNNSGNGDLQFWLEQNNTSKERLRIKSDGNVGVGTDITSAGGAYGKMSVVIPSQSGGAALQVMNSAVGSADGSLTNIVLRSVNNNAANWAHAQYRASSHDFMHEATSILKVESGGVTVTGTLSADSFNGNITGAADQIKTIQRTTNANHFLTFVDSNNTSSTAENLYTQTRLKYNPSTNILRARNFFADADGGTNNNSQQIVAGDGSGSVAMTINDGYGNCNLAFNHRNGVPDSNGSSGRIWTTVDSTTATMYFELADNSTANSAKALTDVLYLQTNRVTPYVNVIPNSDGTLNLGANGTRWATTYTDALEVTNNANIGGNLTVSGTLTYEDVTNVDAIGIITARAGIDVTGGNIDIQTGLLNLSKVGGSNIIEMGKGQTGNHYAYIDMVGDATYTDYGLRILRGNSGANAESQITHRGTGNFLISAAEAAAIKIRTNTGTTPKGLMIAGNGKVGVNNDSPQQALHVDGFIYLGPNNVNTHVHGGASVTYSADTDIYFVCDSNDTSGVAPAGEFIWGGGSNTNTDSNRDFTAAEFGNSGKPRNQYMILDENSLRPASNNGLDLGSSSLRFNNIYATSIVGTISAPGNNTEILFNDGGNVVGADAGLTFNKTSDKLTVGGDIKLGGTLFFDETGGGVEKIDIDGGNLDLHSDGNIRFFESDNDTLMFTFDVNTTNGDARIIMENDTDTYFNHPGSNTLAFTTGGSERLRIDANGNIGLNVTPKTSGTLYSTVDHFLVIGDNDTGIAQDGDGQLEIWANDQEIINFNTTQITPTKSIIPSSNGSLNLGSSSKRWGTIYATTIDGTITGTITNAQSADKIKTQSRSTNAAHYVTFVDSNNGSATSENLYTDNALLYNPSTNILDASRFTAGRSSGSVSMTINDGYGNANLCFNHEAGVPDSNGSSGRIECGVDGTTAQMMFELWDNVTSGSATGGSSSNIVMRLLSNNVQVYEDIIPNSDSTRDIGTNTNRFKHIYCDNLTAGTITGGSGLTDVAVSYTGRTSPCSLPITVTGSTTKTINIPSSSNAFGAKYVQTTQPTGNSICDGDVWYDTSGTQGTGALTITNSTESNYRNIVFVDSSSATTLKVNDNGRIQVRPSDGALRVEGDITAFYSSDCRLKKNVAPIENALDKVNSISGYTFEWNDMTNHEGEEVGVIAQEIEKLGLPNVVTARKDGFYAVRYEKLVPLLIEAIKALKGEIDEIKHTK